MFSLLPFKDVEINQMKGNIDSNETKIRTPWTPTFARIEWNEGCGSLYFILIPFKTEDIYERKYHYNNE